MTNCQALKTDVLERLINRELLYQKSQNNGIKVEEAEVNEQLNAPKKFPYRRGIQECTPQDEFFRDLLTSQIRRYLAVKKLIDTQFVEKATVSKKERKRTFL